MSNEQKIYTCPMHPEIRQDKPGLCPECGMNLTETQDVKPDLSISSRLTGPAEAWPRADDQGSATFGLAKIGKKPIIIGILGVIVMLVIYFTAVGFISDTAFAVSQFKKFWYYIVTLSVGFGIQVGLYTYLRQAVRGTYGSGKVLAVSGGTSTAAMITCCAHYLVNIAPLIATAGVITFITQYQVQFFWIGSVFNIGGIIYIANKIRRFSKHA